VVEVHELDGTSEGVPGDIPEPFSTVTEEDDDAGIS
jgi:hypothetical protein